MTYENIIYDVNAAEDGADAVDWGPSGQTQERDPDLWIKRGLIEVIK